MKNPQFMVHHYMEVDKYVDETAIDKNVCELQEEQDWQTGQGQSPGTLYDGKSITEQRTTTAYVNQWLRPSLAYTANTTLTAVMEGVRRSPRVETQQAKKAVRFNVSPTITRLQRTAIPRKSTAAGTASGRASPPPSEAAIKLAAKKKGRPTGGGEMQLDTEAVQMPLSFLVRAPGQPTPGWTNMEEPPLTDPPPPSPPTTTTSPVPAPEGTRGHIPMSDEIWRQVAEESITAQME